MTKYTKAQVGFEHPAKGQQKCAGCVHFLPGARACRIVSGLVLPGDWCQKWSARKNPTRPEIFRRLMAKARGKKMNSRPKKVMNYGEGNLFNFHGAFTEKADAIRKEQSTPGAFIKTVWYKGGPRYGVLTQRQNPRGKKRNSVIWGRAKRNQRKGETIKRKKSRRKSRRNTVVWGARDEKFVRQAISRLFPGKAISQLTSAQLSAVMQLAQDLKTGKKNPVLKVPGGWRPIGARGRRGPTFKERRDAEIYAESLQNPPKKLCGFMIGRNPCSRKPGHRGPHLPQGATLRPRSRVPGHWIATKRNADVRRTHITSWAKELKVDLTKLLSEWDRASKVERAALYGKLKDAVRQSRGRGNPHGRRRNFEDAGELYEKFHGKEPSGVKEIRVPEADYGSHPELGQLGRLVSIVIGDEDAEKPWKKKIEWKANEAPDLAAEPGGKQLYIIGGSQDLGDFIESLPVDGDKDMLDLGYGYRIEYFAEKAFDNFQPVTYWHQLGEESGIIPRVVYDRVNKRIHIVGGAYEVKSEGIVD